MPPPIDVEHSYGPHWADSAHIESNALVAAMKPIVLSVILSNENIRGPMLPPDRWPKVLSKEFMNRPTDWNHSRSIWIGAANRDGIFRKVDVRTEKVHGLTDQHASRVKKEQEGFNVSGVTFTGETCFRSFTAG
jgi:hypothetical protein